MPGSQRSSEPCRTSRSAPLERVERELVRDPRRKAHHPLDRRLVGGGDRDGTSHREAEEQGSLGTDLSNRGACILDAQVELPPRLDPVSHLGERQAREPRSQPADEPFERRAPGSLDLVRLAAVHADDRRAADDAGDAKLAYGASSTCDAERDGSSVPEQPVFICKAHPR